jgi:hypothetical protein
VKWWAFAIAFLVGGALAAEFLYIISGHIARF